MAQIREQAPEIEIEIIADNTPSNLDRREADIAIRNFRPMKPALIARKIRDDAAALYATPAYLASIGSPVEPAGFSQASFISFADTALIIYWLNGAGMALSHKNFPIKTESYLVQWSLVKQGLGIGIMPQAIGDADTAVVRACPALKPFDFPIWLVAHRELRTSKRIKVVDDLLAAALQAEG